VLTLIEIGRNKIELKNRGALKRNEERVAKIIASNINSFE